MTLLETKASNLIYDFDDMCDCKGPGVLLCWLLIQHSSSFKFTCISEKETLYDQQIFNYSSERFPYRTVYGFSHFIDSWEVYEYQLELHFGKRHLNVHGFTNGTAVEIQCVGHVDLKHLRNMLNEFEKKTHNFYMETILVV